ILVPILLICMVAFGLLAPTTISCISYITIIGIIASSLVSFTFAPMISGYFLLIKHKYLKNVTPLKILNKNYDDIDEETIPGVNQVSKEKTYL
ncbi:MAG: hypothetical protein K2M43_03185, partial [Mycoplasmoidaceae bacterium]|nr:hypothetical protein [Mycoplasmoidaceae bacterium]